MNQSLAGEWKVILCDQSVRSIILPGTLDENGIGKKDIAKNSVHPEIELGNSDINKSNKLIATRFTRKYTYEGVAYISKQLKLQGEKNKRYFIFVERARCLSLLIDEENIEHFRPATISTPHIFEVTKYMDGDLHEITFISDNSYQELPYHAIIDSSAATDETQTNWNGLVGRIEIIEREQNFISEVRVLPNKDELNIAITIDAIYGWKGSIHIQSEVIKEITKEVQVSDGSQELFFNNIPISSSVQRWDELEGNLYRFTVALSNGDKKEGSFGVRDFGNKEGRLALNGRKIFLRSEANCAEFPETGYLPMEKEEWLKILSTYKSYGVNCIRFHSHCPSEAAFCAADELGLLMQPELSNWNPVNAFEQEESYQYYRIELLEIIRTYANHPSFVMLTFGNELQTHELGMDRMHEMIREAHKLDHTRLYANGSNVFYGNEGIDYESDFYTAQRYYKDDLRGTFAAHDNNGLKGYINNQYPSTMVSYDKSMNHLRMKYKKPVFSFEVGQFEVLPDFGEIKKFKGISEPNNYRIIEDKVIKCGLIEKWKDYVEATGELSNLCYREEIEAAMRTERMSGISLLGLQDFPGQGTALVGMLDSHLEPKPYAFAKPERFSSFFRDQSLLVKMPKYTYENSEMYEAEIIIANFGKTELIGELLYKIEIDTHPVVNGRVGQVVAPCGSYTNAGKIVTSLDFIKKASRANLIVELNNTVSKYPIWIYPKTHINCPENIYETREWNDRAIEVLNNGGNVYLSPKSIKESFVHSIQAQFSTDFWSVGTFPHQEGGMGQLIDCQHDLFTDFPTEKHTNWQWWAMANQRAIILPRQMESIITEMDSYAYLRPMTQLLEARCLNGKIMISSLGLQELQEYPEARALQNSIYRYMASEKFLPKQQITVNEMEKIIRKQ